ncbi:UNVERIFIED_CONTAM: hypothetical protein HDU68_007667 [Siphonaria sp. JEL0065]|nr:hypothetical protein HDU68_007667 [Siphonaria sp. JEL0065]
MSSQTKKIALQTKLISIIGELKKQEVPISYKELSKLVGTDITSADELIHEWKNCEKIGYNDQKQEIWFKRQFSIRSKTELLDLLKANYLVGGLDVKVLKEGYSAIGDAIKELEEAGQILVIRGKDGNPKVLYFNNLQSETPTKYPASKEFGAYWSNVTVPDDEKMAEELAKGIVLFCLFAMLGTDGNQSLSAGISVTDMSSAKAIGTVKKAKGKARGRKAKITNTHLEGVDLNIAFNTIPTISPEVLWAQRTDELFVTINAADIIEPQITLTKQQLKFEGTSTAGKKYAVTLDFHAEVDPEASRQNINARALVFVIVKAVKGAGYWPRLLTKSAGKPHFLKTDFSKWKDEDEEDEEVEAAPAGGMDMSQFSGMGGMPGMGGMGGMGGAGGPGGMDLEALMAQMGGAGGLGGAEGMDFSKFAGAGGEDAEDSDDDDLPELEDAPVVN